MNQEMITVFFGGQSSEHDISCRSVLTVIRGLKEAGFAYQLVGITKDGRWLYADSAEAVADGSWLNSAVKAFLLPDASEKSLLLEAPDGSIRKTPVGIAFPVLHGRFGEDGTIQGLFELAQIPYVGCGVAASAVSMDKLYTKVIVSRLDVEQAKYVAFEKHELDDEKAAIARVEKAFPYPVFVKPTDGGSSQGVSCVKSRESLMEALRYAASEGTRVMVEEAISGREIECAVLSREDGPAASGVGEIKAAAQFYDFEAKYNNPDSETDTHPVFPDGKEEEVRAAAVQIFRAVGGHGLARVDFFLEHGTNRVIFNEINTLPGFTSISMYPMLWKEAGLPLGELVKALVASAYTRRK